MDTYIHMDKRYISSSIQHLCAFSVDLSDYTDNEIGDSLTAYPYDNSLFLDKLFGEDVGHMMTKTRRRRHGVYDECCRKPCNYTELASYCL